MGTLLPYLLPLQAAAEEDSGDNPLLKASPGLMIWTLVIFGITLFILKRYVFGPVGAAIEKRRADIAQSIEEAEQQPRRGDRAARGLQGPPRGGAQGGRPAPRAGPQGGRAPPGAEIVSDAQGQRERVLNDAEVQIQAQARAAASGIRDDVVQLALLAAEKVSRRSLSDDEHRQLIEQAIDEADLSALPGNGAKPAS